MNRIEEIAREIKLLEGEEESLSTAVNEVRKRIRSAQLERIEIQFGVKIGSFVTGEKGRYRVESIDPSFSRPLLYGQLQKKDGQFSERKTCIYGDWKVEESPCPTNS